MNSPTSSVSFVIPNYNGVDLFPKHLSDIITAAQGAEIIVVDDASTDNSVEYLHLNYPDIKVVTLTQNQRFAAACNAGVTAASGEIIVLLNSDVSPQPDFLTPLINSFADPLVFAVGCKEEQIIDGKTTFAGRAGGTFKRGMFIHWRSVDQNNLTTLWVSGGSGAFRKQMWDRLGGMDTLFAPAYEEDRDLCYRALKRGWKVMFNPESIVHHQHETTNQDALGRALMHTSAHKNNLIFIWKNITSPRLIIQHLAWLPYHLIVGTIRTQGAFFYGFMKALSVLPTILKKRQTEQKEQAVSDETIVQQAAAY